MDKINAKVFTTVARTGSFRKAAEELDYTQAGISYIVASMEEATGLCLFVREHDGVRLSPEGEALLPQLRQLEVWERQFSQTVDEMRGLARGVVRVQIFDSISIHWIPDIVKRFQTDYPGVRIELVTEEDSVRAEEMVMSGEVDCGFFLTKVTAKMDVFPLLEESMLAVVSKEHPLAKSDCFPVEDLSKYPYIAMKYDAHTGIGDIFHEHGAQPQTVFSMDNDYATLAMVQKGLGFCIFPELLLKEAPYDLVTLPFDVPKRRTISIGTRAMRHASKACCKFMEYTLRWVEENTGNTANVDKIHNS